MRNLHITHILLLIVSTTVLAQEYKTPVGSSECIGPTDKIKVVVVARKNDLTTDYKISLTNMTEYPLRSFTFGYGEITGFIAFEDIKVTDAPDDWNSSSGNYYESSYRRIVWWAKYDKKKQKLFTIPPGETMVRFGVRTVIPKKEYLNRTTVIVDDITTGPLDLTKMPYKIEVDKPIKMDGSHHKGSCLWGLPTISK